MGTIYYKQFTPYLEIFEPRSVYVSELRLQHAWKQFLWKKPFEDNLGRSIRILSAGRHNFSDGPDFLQASFMADGKLCTGDIEIHFRASDWYAHKHQFDKNYNDCVLHIVFQPPDSCALAKTLNGAEIPVCYIPLEEIYDYEAPGSCRIFKANESEYFSILKKQGWERVNKKTKYFYNNRSRFPRDVMLYWGLFKASGYRYNEENMIKLFLRFPWAAYCDELLDRKDIRPMLDGLAGFTDYHHLENRIKWTYSRTRPQHFPERRIAWLAELMVKYYRASLCDIVYDNFRSKEDIKIVKGILFNPGLVNVPGPAIQQEMLLNTVLPLLESIRVEEKDREPMKSLIHNYVESAKVPQAYGIVKRFHDKHGIPLTASEQRSWIISQGVLSIHEHYCSQSGQMKCPICLMEK